MTDATRNAQLSLDGLIERAVHKAPRFVSPAPPPRRATIDELEAQDSAEESRFAVIGWKLMGGVAVPTGYLRLVHANRMDTADDRSRFDTDFELRVDGRIAGYLDIEVKHGWNGGSFPYEWINVAKHPMAHWKHGRFNGRLTNKLIDFHKLPATSFWVGVRRDFNAAMVVRASDLFFLGEDHQQQTAYHDVPLPVIRVRRDVGSEINDPHAFAELIVSCFGDA